MKRVTFTYKQFAPNKRDFDIVEIVKDFYDTPKSTTDMQISYYQNHNGMIGIEKIEEIEDESVPQISL